MPEVDIIDVRYTGRPRRSRTRDERLMIRFPWGWRALSRLAQHRLRPGSALRRALIRSAIVSAWQATSRKDFGPTIVRYAEDAELTFDPDLEAIGLAGPYHGRRGVVERERAFQSEWQEWNAEPLTVLDLDERLIVLGTVRLVGKASGLALEREVLQIVTGRDGVVVRDQIFFGWERGLRAAGLDPKDIALPARSDEE
jgi:hypothetical protein